MKWTWVHVGSLYMGSYAFSWFGLELHFGKRIWTKFWLWKLSENRFHGCQQDMVPSASAAKRPVDRGFVKTDYALTVSNFQRCLHWCISFLFSFPKSAYSSLNLSFLSYISMSTLVVYRRLLLFRSNTLAFGNICHFGRYIHAALSPLREG